MSKYDYKGAIHCHSQYSDGTGTYKEIAEAADAAGLDFVMMSDHDTLKPIDDGEEGWKGSTLFIVGSEITPPKNHYLAFGEKKFKGIEKLKAKEPQQIIDEIQKHGWLGFIAHPDHTGTKKFEVPASPWEAWDVKGFTGMGIWDLMTDWLSQLDRDGITIEVYEDFAAWLNGPRRETLQRWDALTQQGKIVGIGEIDNHRAERDYEGKKIVVFPYDVAFRTVTNHILLDEPLDKDAGKAKSQVLEAIRRGSLYISFDYTDDPTEFNFEIDDGENSAGMGEDFALTEVAELLITLPDAGLINVLRNGESVHEVQGDEAVVEITEPGVYRVEVMRNDLTWILSNPIYVKSQA